MSFRLTAQSYMQQLFQERQQGGEGHPETGLLRAYHSGSLSAEEGDRIQEHLATCPECAERFLGLVHFLEWDLDPDRLSVDELAGFWEKFQEKRREEEEAIAAVAVED
jgi:Putative zinc-finger